MKPLKDWLKRRRISAITREWRKEKAELNGVPSRAIRRVVIIPSDPWSLVGARGDEAMMMAVTCRLRLGIPDLDVAVVVATHEATLAASRMGFRPLKIWCNKGFMPMFRGIFSENVDLLIVLGADVMDGFYDTQTSLRLLAVADLCARSGIRSVLLGFSFNEHPASEVVDMFNGVTGHLKINIRDPISLRRFKKYIYSATPRLVADTAFMLEPDNDGKTYAYLSEWVNGHHSEGRVAVAFNVHPVLVKGLGEAAVAQLIQSSIDSLRSLMLGRAVSLVLMAHDYRGLEGDDTCLKPIYQELRIDFPARVFFLEERLSAAQLKGCAGLMDGVVTGRMHLAIAALGMGVPTAALTYQDKFQGLFEHFSLPQDLLLAPSKALKPSDLLGMLLCLVDQLPILRQQIAKALPHVGSMASLNIDGLTNLKI